MRIAVVGAGNVGLVTGACLADFGHTVICVDLNEAKIAALDAGSLPIFEPGLSELVSRNVADGRLAFSTRSQRQSDRSRQCSLRWERRVAPKTATLTSLASIAPCVDLRNIYRREDVERHGFAYSCVGRPAKRTGADPVGDDDQLRAVPRERMAAPRLVRPTA